ncbi:MAG: ATP-binding cassette domain-containing protein [Chloroflexota bacterium]|jgi:ABC-2 type transport system ATP-binding protein
MIKVDGLEKSYGPVRALRGISFEIAEGEIVGLLGPNGAGKTTTIKTLTGYLQPDGGSVFVDGLDVVTETREVQKRLGYLPESAPLYPELTVREYLSMMAGLRQIPPDEEEAWIDEAVASTGLSEHLARPIDELSKGYRQRVGLAQAILHKPRLLILDEPTIGLDPTQIVEIRNLIRRLSAHSTVLFSTHILPEVEALCDRVIMLFSGQIKVDATMSELASTTDALLTVDGPVDGLEDRLGQLDGVAGVEALEPAAGHVTYRVRGEEQADLCPAIYRVAADNGWPVRELRPDSQTLESVFNKMAVAE